MISSFSIGEVGLYLEDNGFFLESDYLNNKIPLVFRDVYGYKYSLSLDALKGTLKKKLLPEKISPHNSFSVHNINLFLKNFGSYIRVVGGEYINNLSKTLETTCTNCDSQSEDSWINLRRRKYACKHCENRIRNDRIDIYNYFISKNIDVLNINNYITEDSELNLSCLDCGNFWQSSYRKIKRAGCPNCSFVFSSGELAVESVLNDLHLDYKRQKVFPDCKYKKSLRFDFYLPVYDLVIEYQGHQHYYPVDFSGKGKDAAIERYNWQKLIDEKKKEYCKNRGILFIEIPYWQIQNVKNIIIEYIGGFRENSV